MPKLTDYQVPSYCRHRASGQAVVTLDGQDIYLGKHGTAASHREYNRLIAEWLASGRRIPQAIHELTVTELIDAYWQHVQRYYLAPDGTPTQEVDNVRQAVRPVKKLYGRTRAIDFGPLSLKAMRQSVIDGEPVLDPVTGVVIGRNGRWSRRHINKQISRIKLMFKWAVGNELIPPSVHQALAAVGGLRKGRSAAKETKPVRPVPEQHVYAIKDNVSRQVWALIELQMCTGARGGELFGLRGRDIDMSRKVWVYHPSSHKTAHRDIAREIWFGPKAQDIIRPFLKPDVNAYLFSPAEAEAERLAKLHAARKTPLSCGNTPGSNVKRKPKRKPGEVYNKDGYAHAITRACRKAGVPHWHPHQLRHNAATRLRRDYGIEAARVILGHQTGAITEIYAEQDMQLAEKVMGEVG